MFLCDINNIERIALILIEKKSLNCSFQILSRIIKLKVINIELI